jgi:hypothetical protein
VNVEVDEEREYRRSVDDQRPLHPQRELASREDRLSGVEHSNHELDLLKISAKPAFNIINRKLPERRKKCRGLFNSHLITNPLP